jgi:hypothetical protein
MNMTLIKYKELKILVDENMQSDIFTTNVQHIYRLFEAQNKLMQNMLNASDKDIRHIKQLKSELNQFIQQSKVIGYPFDNHDAELYALDRKINYTILEIHGNTGTANAAKAEVKQSQIQMRVSQEQKAKWVKQAQKEGLKLSEWITRVLNKN